MNKFNLTFPSSILIGVCSSLRISSGGEYLNTIIDKLFVWNKEIKLINFGPNEDIPITNNNYN